MVSDIPIATAELIEAVVKDYESHAQLLENLRQNLLQITTDPRLTTLIHSVKSRRKDADHLREKLERKYRELSEKGKTFHYTVENYLEEVNDLVGIRLLHLHTSQVKDIDPQLRLILDDNSYVLIEGPTAKTWDVEYRSFFESCNIACEESPSLYTSIHYVVRANMRNPYTAEIQVRTLSEELWGETNHRLNYPNLCESLSCREQIKALARVTSSATRLVDSIFSTFEDYVAVEGEKK